MLSITKRVIRRIKLIYNYFRYEIKYSEKEYIKRQEKKFKSLNLNRKNGQRLFLSLKKKIFFSVITNEF